MGLKIIETVIKGMPWEWDILIRDWKFENWPQSRSVKNFNVDVSGDDQIITLSTCTSDLNKRIVIHAKKVN